MAITLQNQASLDYTSCGVATSALSNTATTVLNGTVNLNKTSYDDEYRANRLLTFVLNVQSEDEIPDGSVTIRDDLGAFTQDGVTRIPLTYRSYMLFLDGNPRQDIPVSVDNDPARGVIFTVTGIPATARLLTIVYQAEANEYADLTPGVGRIDNTAVLNIAGADVDTAVAAITVECYANVEIEKTMTPNPVSPGEAITYTFILRNYGTASPTAVTLRDTLRPALESPLLSVTVNGTATAAYTYDPATGEFLIGDAAATPYAFDIPASDAARDPATGIVAVTPGVVTVQVTGTVRQ